MADENNLYESQRQKIEELMNQNAKILQEVQDEHARLVNAYNYITAQSDVALLTKTNK